MPSLPPSGSSHPRSSVSAHSFWIGLGVAGAAIALAVLGFSLQSDTPNELPAGARLDRIAPVDSPPVSIAIAADSVNHQPLMEVSRHEGRQVYRIRVTDSGDEIIIDYFTGKLIAVREISPKFSSPFPKIESTATSS